MASVTIEIGGRSFPIAPYMLDEMCEAAPFMDELKAESERLDAIFKAGADPRLSDLANLGRIICGILAPGISRIDPSIDAQALRRMIGVQSVLGLQQAVLELMKASGMIPAGEAKAPSRPKSRRKGARA